MGTFRTELEFLEFVKNKMLADDLTEGFVANVIRLANSNDKAYEILEKWLASDDEVYKLGLEVEMLGLLEENE